MLSGFFQKRIESARQCGKLEFVEGSQSIEQHCHLRTSAPASVEISIEFQTAYRHTDGPILPFPGIHPREMVLLFRRLPHQESGLVRNDREFVKFQSVSLLTKANSLNLVLSHFFPGKCSARSPFPLSLLPGRYRRRRKRAGRCRWREAGSSPRTGLAPSAPR